MFPAYGLGFRVYGYGADGHRGGSDGGFELFMALGLINSALARVLVPASSFLYKPSPK